MCVCVCVHKQKYFVLLMNLIDSKRKAIVFS